MFTDAANACTCAPLSAAELQAAITNPSLEPECTCGARVHRCNYTRALAVLHQRTSVAADDARRRDTQSKRVAADAAEQSKQARAAAAAAKAEVDAAAQSLADTNAALQQAEDDLDALLSLRDALRHRQVAEVGAVDVKAQEAADAVAQSIAACANIDSADLNHEINQAAKEDVQRSAAAARHDVEAAGRAADAAASAARQDAADANATRAQGRSGLLAQLEEARALLDEHGDLQEAVAREVDARVKAHSDESVPPVTLTYLLDLDTPAAHVQHFTGTDRTGLLMLLCSITQTESMMEILQSGRGSTAMTPAQQLLVALFKLSRNLPYHMIARTLGINADVSTTTHSRCFVKVVLALTEHVKRSWGRPWSEDLVNQNRLPECQGSFSLVHLIGDCSSTKTQGTRSHLQKMFTFSPYYGTTCMKWALALNCAGVLEWVSAAHCGNSNEANMCSDQTNPLSPSLIDAILDRHTLLYDKGGGQLSTLCHNARKGYMCPYHKREGKMSAFELNRSELISSRRSHVERGVKKMKRRLIISGLPLARALFPIADEILYLCCFLSHLDGPLPFAGNTMLDEDGFLDDAFVTDGLGDADGMWDEVAAAVDEAADLVLDGPATEQTVPGE